MRAPATGASGRPAVLGGSAAGSGEQTLEWDPKDGDWRAVVMNANATRGVAADLSIGAELDPVLWIGIGLLASSAACSQLLRRSRSQALAAAPDHRAGRGAA